MFENAKHAATAAISRSPFLRRAASYLRLVFARETALSTRLVYILAGVAALGGLALTLVLLYALILIPFTPGIHDLKRAKVERPSVLMSADGAQLALYKRMNRRWLKLKRVSPAVVDALIATEDHRFYQHHGLDIRRTIASIGYSLRGDLQGGSTITQQLARNLYPESIGRAPTLTRKLKEIITALKIEYAYTKPEILETYLNTVPFLYNAYGIEMAARTYFDKSASELDLLESATLVGMLKGTSYYNPVRNPERAIDRRNVVLAQMVKYGKLSPARYRVLKDKPLDVAFERQVEPLGPAPHFAERIRRWLAEWADRNDYDIYADGLVVYSTIDSRFQRFANQAIARQMERLQAVADVEWGLRSGALLSTHLGSYRYSRSRVTPFRYFWQSHPGLLQAFIRETPAYAAARAAGHDDQAAIAALAQDKNFIHALQAQKTQLQSGFVAIDPRTGFVKAWVGSRDFSEDGFDHVNQARRQPGSTFKPFVYGAAVDAGLRPDSTFQDKAVEFRLKNGSIWRPTDAGPPSGRTMTMEDGLVYSKNTITAQVMQQVGPKKVARFAKVLGVNQSKLDPVPSLALGTSPVTLFEMVSAYGTIAANGEYRPPVMVTRVTDRAGNVLVEFTSKAERATDSTNTATLVDMMRGVVNRGTGQGIRTVFGIRADVAGKTGTTQNNTDGWFILMHPQIVAGAWVGFNDARIAMRSDYWGQGGHNALYLVGDFYRQSFAARALDARAALPTMRTPSFFGPLFDRIERWLHGDREPAPAVPAPAPSPAPPEDAPPADDPARDAIERLLDAEKVYRDSAREAGKIIDQHAKEIRDVQREIENILRPDAPPPPEPRNDNP